MNNELYTTSTGQITHQDSVKKKLPAAQFVSSVLPAAQCFHQKILPAAHFFSLKVFVICPIFMKPNAFVILIIVKIYFTNKSTLGRPTVNRLSCLSRMCCCELSQLCTCCLGNSFGFQPKQFERKMTSFVTIVKRSTSKRDLWLQTNKQTNKQTGKTRHSVC